MDTVLCNSCVIDNNYTKTNITQILTNSVCKSIILICIGLYYLKFQEFCKGHFAKKFQEFSNVC